MTASNHPPAGVVEAVAYLRTSTTDQKLSLKAQKTSVTAYVTYKRIDLLRRVCEHNSAVKTHFLDRPVVQELLAWCDTTGVRHIIIDKVDRAFRDTIDCLTTVAELQKKGYTLAFLDLDIDTSTPMGEVLLTFAAAMARWESRRRKERQTAVVQEKRKGGHSIGHAPVGWKLERDATVPTSRRDQIAGRERAGNRIVPHPPAQLALLVIVRLWNNGLRAAAIATALNDGGHLSATGKQWRASSVDSAVRTARIGADYGTADHLHTSLINPPAGLAV